MNNPELNRLLLPLSPLAEAMKHDPEAMKQFNQLQESAYHLGKRETINFVVAKLNIDEKLKEEILRDLSLS